MNTDARAKMEAGFSASANVAAQIRQLKNQYRWLALLLMAAGISSNSFGTTVIVLIRDNNLWMAADSMLNNTSGRREGCKIGQGKGFYWASASPMVEAPEFRIDPSMAKIQVTDEPLLQKMKALLEKSRTPITEQLERLRARDRTRFQALMKVANHDLVKIIFVGIENHVPTVVWATVVAEEHSGRITVSTDTLKSLIPAEVRDGVVGAGLTKDAFKYLGEHQWESVDDPVPLLRESVRAEETANPHAVGGPISILRFSEAGADWVDSARCSQRDSKRPIPVPTH